MFKQYQSYLRLLQFILEGKRSIIVAPDYVVVSRNVWEQMYEQKNRIESKYYDEMKPFTKEDYQKLLEIIDAKHNK